MNLKKWITSFGNIVKDRQLDSNNSFCSLYLWISTKALSQFGCRFVTVKAMAMTMTWHDMKKPDQKEACTFWKWVD